MVHRQWRWFSHIAVNNKYNSCEFHWVGRLKFFSRFHRFLFKKKFEKADDNLSRSHKLHASYFPFHNRSRYTVIGSTPRIERTCSFSLLNLLLSVTKVGVNPSINNLGDDGETSGLAQDQELQAKNGHLGSHPLPAPLRPLASCLLSLCLYFFIFQRKTVITFT